MASGIFLATPVPGLRPESGSGLGTSIEPNGLRLDLWYDMTFQAVSEGRRKGHMIFL